MIRVSRVNMDGITGLEEERELGTDPLNRDTDGDGCFDGFECATGNNDYNLTIAFTEAPTACQPGPPQVGKQGDGRGVDPQVLPEVHEVGLVEPLERNSARFAYSHILRFPVPGGVLAGSIRQSHCKQLT